MAFKKFAKRVARKGVAYAKKRYVKKTVGKSIASVARDVARLKSVLNPELKMFNFNNATGSQSRVPIGQVNGATANGYFALDITPIPGQGVTDITRNGDSIKLSKTHIKYQFYGMSAQHTPVKLKYYIVSYPGITQTDVNLGVMQLLSPNVFNGLYDYNSDRNIDAKNQVRIVKTGTIYHKGTYAVSSSQFTITDKTMILKFKNHHVKYQGNTTTVSHGQLIMYIFADNGNCSIGTVSTLPNIPVTNTYTGVYLNYDVTHFFYDN